VLVIRPALPGIFCRVIAWWNWPVEKITRNLNAIRAPMSFAWRRLLDFCLEAIELTVATERLPVDKPTRNADAIG
jgi:hypothetical protein